MTDTANKLFCLCVSQNGKDINDYIVIADEFKDAVRLVENFQTEFNKDKDISKQVYGYRYVFNVIPTQSQVVGVVPTKPTE